MQHHRRSVTLAAWVLNVLAGAQRIISTFCGNRLGLPGDDKPALAAPRNGIFLSLEPPAPPLWPMRMGSRASSNNDRWR